MTSTHAHDVWVLVLMSSNLRSTFLIKSMHISFGGFLASCSHEQSEVFWGVQNWLFPSTNSILHLSTATNWNLAEASDGKPLVSVNLFGFFFFFFCFQNFLFPRVLHTNSVALLEKRTLVKNSLYHILMIGIFG